MRPPCRCAWALAWALAILFLLSPAAPGRPTSVDSLPPLQNLRTRQTTLSEQAPELPSDALGQAGLSSGGAAGDDDILEVFVVPHSHCDPSWKYTFLEYYKGHVQDILQTVTALLWESPLRRFTWADISYLALWMARNGDKPSHLSRARRLAAFDKTGALSNQTANTESKARDVATWREAFEELVSAAQMEVVHGGWVQHDEALSTLADTLDLIELGQRYVSSLLGRRSKIAWLIDSFGHTGSTPGAFRALTED